MTKYIKFFMKSHGPLQAVAILLCVSLDLQAAAAANASGTPFAMLNLERALNQIISGPVTQTIRPSQRIMVQQQLVDDAFSALPATATSIKIMQDATPEQLQNLLRNKKFTAFENLQHLTPEQLQLLAFDPSTYFPRRALKILAPKMTVEDVNNLLIKNHAKLLANYKQLPAQHIQQYNDECIYIILSNLPPAEFQKLKGKALANVSEHILNKISQENHVITPQQRREIAEHQMRLLNLFEPDRPQPKFNAKQARQETAKDGQRARRTQQVIFDEQNQDENRFMRRAAMPTGRNAHLLKLPKRPQNFEAAAAQAEAAAATVVDAEAEPRWW